MNKINKNLFELGIIIVLAILASSTVLAQEENFDEAVSIIELKIPCSQLTDEQFELLGDYYMEQMHPGELHEIMDDRIGGEGSAQLRNVHIAMGRSFYCADNNAMPMSMMHMMMGRNNINYGMMGNYPNYPSYNNSYSSFSATSILINILIIILIIIAIIGITKLLK